MTRVIHQPYTGQQEVVEDDNDYVAAHPANIAAR
jgi:hypothetical protein